MSIIGGHCPGQSTMFWRPEDVYELPCPHCGYSIEFFKTDLKRKCPQCDQEVLNPKANFSCAEWCKHAEECLGPAVYSQAMEKRELEGRRKSDLESLLSFIPTQDREAKALFEKLYRENTDLRSLFDVRKLRLLRDKEPSLVERAMNYYRKFAKQRS